MYRSAPYERVVKISDGFLCSFLDFCFHFQGNGRVEYFDRNDDRYSKYVNNGFGCTYGYDNRKIYELDKSLKVVDVLYEGKGLIHYISTIGAIVFFDSSEDKILAFDHDFSLISMIEAQDWVLPQAFYSDGTFYEFLENGIQINRDDAGSDLLCYPAEVHGLSKVIYSGSNVFVEFYMDDNFILYEFCYCNLSFLKIFEAKGQFSNNLSIFNGCYFFSVQNNVYAYSSGAVKEICYGEPGYFIVSNDRALYISQNSNSFNYIDSDLSAKEYYLPGNLVLSTAFPTDTGFAFQFSHDKGDKVFNLGSFFNLYVDDVDCYFSNFDGFDMSDRNVFFEEKGGEFSIHLFIPHLPFFEAVNLLISYTVGAFEDYCIKSDLINFEVPPRVERKFSGEILYVVNEGYCDSDRKSLEKVVEDLFNYYLVDNNIVYLNDDKRLSFSFV